MQFTAKASDLAYAITVAKRIRGSNKGDLNFNVQGNTLAVEIFPMDLAAIVRIPLSDPEEGSYRLNPKDIEPILKKLPKGTSVSVNMIPRQVSLQTDDINVILDTWCEPSEPYDSPEVDWETVVNLNPAHAKEGLKAILPLVNRKIYRPTLSMIAIKCYSNGEVELMSTDTHRLGVFYTRGEVLKPGIVTIPYVIAKEMLSLMDGQSQSIQVGNDKYRTYRKVVLYKNGCEVELTARDAINQVYPDFRNALPERVPDCSIFANPRELYQQLESVQIAESGQEIPMVVFKANDILMGGTGNNMKPVKVINMEGILPESFFNVAFVMDGLKPIIGAKDVYIDFWTNGGIMSYSTMVVYNEKFLYCQMGVRMSSVNNRKIA